MASGNWMGRGALVVVFSILAACGGEYDPNEKDDLDGYEEVVEAPRNLNAGDVRLRLAAANTTTGTQQSYTPGHGARIMKGTKPDIVMVQEFNYGSNTATDIRSFVDSTFGTSYQYYREAGAQIPNGIISRYPIIASGEWDDPKVSNRDFAWARIDIPGSVHLWAISVHFLTSSATDRNAEAQALVNFIKSKVPAGEYVAIGGDLNTGSRSESALSTLSQVVVTSGPYPVDHNNNGNTSASRSKPLDWMLVSSGLHARRTSTDIGSSTFPNGAVIDTRVYSPIAEISPAVSSDSGASYMQHMQVVRDFGVPSDTTTSSVTVTAPNGGESWTASTSKSITWTSSNVGSVRIEYSADNGSTWSVVASSVSASTGSYAWTTPSAATSTAKIRITDTANAATTDASNAAFSIVASGGGTVTPAITAESESNNTYGTADGRVGNGVSVSGGVGSSTDVDWFKFEVKAGGSVTISLAMPGGQDLDWYLYHSSSTSYYLTRGYTISNPETKSYTVSKTGTYYVKVVGYSGATGSYNLKVTASTSVIDP